MAIRAVFFDVGETLIDETRHWGEWADEMGVPRFTFFAALGGVIARGQHHRKVFEVLDPTFDVAAAETRRRARGMRYEFREIDFYPDAIPCLTRLKRDGIVVGIAGNQPEGCENALSRAGVAADVLASSHAWGVEKPSAEFFHRIVASCGLPAKEIAYVGDRVDNFAGARGWALSHLDSSRAVGVPESRSDRQE